jgi:hypothetical protein
MWLNADRLRELGEALQIDSVAGTAFGQVEIFRLSDGSILIYDDNGDGWRSVASDYDCSLMLSSRYAPDRIDRWWRNRLRY